jgi:uncharacterized protein (DUF302 family)
MHVKTDNGIIIAPHGFGQSCRTARGRTVFSPYLARPSTRGLPLLTESSMSEVRTIPFQGERFEWVVKQPFARTLAKLRSTLSRPKLLKMLIFIRLGGKSKLKSYLNSVAGESGLMILGTVPHGRLYRLLEDGPTRAQMFLIGNPLIALNMMRVHAESGVYAPLRVMFSEDGPNKTVITYDQPSRMFGQWQDPVFQQTGQILDQKMETLIRELAK